MVNFGRLTIRSKEKAKGLLNAQHDLHKEDMRGNYERGFNDGWRAADRNPSAAWVDNKYSHPVRPGAYIVEYDRMDGTYICEFTDKWRGGLHVVRWCEIPK